MVGSAAIRSSANSGHPGYSGEIGKAKCRRKQNRQWTPHLPVVTIRDRFANFRSRPAPSTTSASPTGSAVNSATWVSSASLGRTWASSGSCGSPDRIRAKNVRGTKTENSRAAPTAPSASDSGRSNWRHNSAGSVRASASTTCQSRRLGSADNRPAELPRVTVVDITQPGRAGTIEDVFKFLPFGARANP